MADKIIFFYGILKDGNVLELNSDDAFTNPHIVYLIKGDLDRKTPKGFSIFKYSLFVKDKRVEDRVINWGNIKCKLPENDIWGSTNGGNNNGVIFQITLNDKFILTFSFQNHSVDTIKEMMNFLILFKNYNTVIKD